MSETRNVKPGERTGSVRIPASKSRAHRLLIGAALSGEQTEIECHGLSKDIRATADCLAALGAGIRYDPETALYTVTPLKRSEAGTGRRELYCGESGSTLRFLLPVVGALGADAVFHMEGRLPERPLEPLKSLLESRGMTIRREENLLLCGGTLCPGEYEIPGNISSQYISGLLFALPLLSGDSVLKVTGNVESADYIAMTEDAQRLAGFMWEKEDRTWRIPGNQTGSLTGRVTVEADWSSAAFFLCMGALSRQGVRVKGMNPASLQGDRAVLDMLKAFGAEVYFEEDDIVVRGGDLRGIRIDASGIPDLVPVLSAVACGAEGITEIVGAERLRIKESDRLQTTSEMLNALGAEVEEKQAGLVIHGKGRKGLRGGTVSSRNDHRIAMSAAVAASLCREAVTVTGAECTEKSFPGFWESLDTLEKTEERE